MPTTILYRGFGVRQHCYLKTEYRKGTLVFHSKTRLATRRCAVCGLHEAILKGKLVRWLRTLPIGNRKVFLSLHLHRTSCRYRGTVRQEPNSLSLPKRRWTKALGRFVVELLRHATVEDVADHLGLEWDTVKEIHIWDLRQEFRRRKVRHLRHLGIAEGAVRKGHHYLTVCVSLDSGEVVWVEEGRDPAALTPFLRRLKRARAKIAAIAVDKWTANLKAILERTSRWM